MRDPLEALEAARVAAARKRTAADGERTSTAERPPGAEHGLVPARRLAEWAIIAPDESLLYSTRRYGRPISALKRFLVRFLRQYLEQVNAQQSRFNAHVAAHVVGLEQRVAALEQAARDREVQDR
jgi:hypothetical protein